MPHSLLACGRLLLTVLHLLHGALICAVVFPFLDRHGQMQRVQWWCRRMLRLVGIALQIRGTVHPGPVLLVANHVSWLDILVINAARPARFVSKADVRRWPLIGWLVACSGTLFIERERKRDALRVVHQVAQALQEGHTIAVFPEGTTSDGTGLLPFHANVLQSAIAASACVQPIALRYSDRTSPISPAAAYIDDMTLVGSIWRVVSARELQVRVQLLDAEAGADLNRRALADRLHARIEAALPLLR